MSDNYYKLRAEFDTRRMREREVELANKHKQDTYQAAMNIIWAQYTAQLKAIMFAALLR